MAALEMTESATLALLMRDSPSSAMVDWAVDVGRPFCRLTRLRAMRFTEEEEEEGIERARDRSLQELSICERALLI